MSEVPTFILIPAPIEYFEAGARIMQARMSEKTPGELLHSLVFDKQSWPEGTTIKGTFEIIAERIRQPLLDRIAELERENKILCPDHRDKQIGKACLACEVEKMLTMANREDW